MRIFYDSATWGGKVNFVDKNNVLVGYDMGQSCCEQFGWYICDELVADMYFENKETEEELNVILEKYNFDPSFIEYPEGTHGEDSYVAFKLLKRKNGKPKYLVLFNCHNGYYSHGFDMSLEGKNIQSGYL